MSHSINLDVLLSECLTTTFSCFFGFFVLFFFYVKNVSFCCIILLYFDKLHLKCMIILCTVQRGSAYNLLTSTSTFFRTICEIGFTC